jgi:hypothetical protein
MIGYLLSSFATHLSPTKTNAHFFSFGSAESSGAGA